MLQNKLIHGTGTSAPKATLKKFPVGPRAYCSRVRQEPCVTGNEFQEAYSFVGVPLAEEDAKKILLPEQQSGNYGVVLLPKFRLNGLDLNSRAVLDSNDDYCAIAGLLPTQSLRWDMTLRGYLLDAEGIIYVSKENIQGLNLETIE